MFGDSWALERAPWQELTTGLDWSEKLYKDGFETKANLDKDRLAVSQSKLRLEQTQRALWMVETFDNPKSKRSLEATLQEAKENLDRVKLQGERKLAQYTAQTGGCCSLTRSPR
jgi:multidrug resistance efflux pump